MELNEFTPTTPILDSGRVGVAGASQAIRRNILDFKSQSNSTNNFDNFWYQTYKTGRLIFTVISLVTVSYVYVAKYRLLMQQVCRRQAIIVTRKSWVMGHVVMGHVGHGSRGSWVSSMTGQMGS